MKITEYIMEEIIDPTGLINGERYEFKIYITLDEEDELYSEGGTGIRVIFAVEEATQRIAMAHFFKRENDEVLDFELEDDELQEILEFCKTNYQEESTELM